MLLIIPFSFHFVEFVFTTITNHYTYQGSFRGWTICWTKVSADLIKIFQDYIRDIYIFSVTCSISLSWSITLFRSAADKYLEIHANLQAVFIRQRKENTSSLRKPVKLEKLSWNVLIAIQYVKQDYHSGEPEISGKTVYDKALSRLSTLLEFLLF